MSSLKDEIRKRGPFDGPQQEVFLNLLRTTDRLQRELDEVLKTAGLSGVQYNVLRILRGAGPETALPCGEVADRMITRDPDMTRLLDRLERRGLIARCRGTSDRRVVEVRITEQGLALLAQLDRPLADAHKRQLAHLEHQELLDLLRLLDKARNRTE